MRTTYEAGTIRRAIYDPRGLLTGLTAPDLAVGSAYHAVGRPTAITQPATGTVGYGYDAVGNRTRTTYPDSTTITNQYTAANQLATSSDSTGILAQFGYDAAGRRTTAALRNGVTTTSQYDAAGNVLALTHASAGTPFAVLTAAYDATGRRTSTSDNGTTTTYTYDGLYRLTDAVYRYQWLRM